MDETEYREDDRDATLEEEVAEVHALSFQKAIEAQMEGREDSTRLKALRESRKRLHEETVQRWHEERKVYYDDVEDEVVRIGDGVKAELNGLDERVLAELSRLKDDSYSVRLEEEQVEAVWEGVNSLLSQRRVVVEGFGQKLENLEVKRLRDMKERLRQLVRDLVDIAHELGPVIQRFVEEEARDVNRVVLTNRREAAQLLTAMRRAHVEAHARARLHWEGELSRWRRLRHDDAIAEYTARLDGPDYKKPKERTRLMKTLQSLRNKRHKEQR